MKLIDRDKLQRTEGIFTYRFTDDLDILSCCAYRYEDVETAPTVEAIPVEWIRNEIASSIEVVRDGDYDHTYASCILQLLERWEKENEREID